MGFMDRVRLHWHRADTDETTTQEAVITGEKTPAPPGVADGVSVTVEPMEPAAPETAPAAPEMPAEAEAWPEPPTATPEA